MDFENFHSQVVIKNRFPDHLSNDENVLLYDLALLELDSEEFPIKDFVESFPNRLGLKGGEAIKNFADFPKNLDRLLKVWPVPARRSHSLVVMGGGTLGDFGGFVASILKRGVGLVHIPSTWLSAMDSAHGGKNALNLTGLKNQIGTFYPASKVYIVKDLLEAGPIELKQQSYGELIKMGLIGESKFFKEIIHEKRPAEDFIWRFIKFCVEDKYQVILQDPYETKKIRQVLNFGHTFGHALESHFGWPHGDAVLQGIFFALEWSRYRGDLAQSTFDEIIKVINEKFDRGLATTMKWYRRPSARSIQKALEADKKIDSSGRIQYVFLKTIGRPVLKPILVEDLISEAKRQNWIR